MRYATLKDIVNQAKAQMTGGFGPYDADTYPVYPGPNDPSIPTGFILLTSYAGPGLNTDDLFDAQGWQIKVASEQHSYDDGEAIAFAIDRYLNRLYSGWYGGQWVADFQRVGGQPSVLMVDDADRTHFVCSYVVDVESMAG